MAETPARAERHPRLAGHAALVVVQVCFGLLPVFAKHAEGFTPRAIAAWRIGAGALVFAVLAGAVHGRRALPARGDLLRLQACSLLGVSLNQVFFLEGLERSTAVNAGLMMLLIPVFTFLIAVLVRQERFAPRRGLGILLAFAGAAWLVGQRDPDLGRPHLLGNALMAVNTLCYSVYLVASRPLARRYPPLVLIAWVYGLSAWTIPCIADPATLLPHAPARGWVALALILLFPTILAYLLNTFALARVAASTTAVYVFLQPLVSGSAGVFVLGEPFGSGAALAAAAMVAGIWLVIGYPRGQRPIAAMTPRC
jgi:drug/metabolite transporter (DMT)-like permease